MTSHSGRGASHKCDQMRDGPQERGGESKNHVICVTFFMDGPLRERGLYVEAVISRN